jgi:hypothetical protein
MTWNAPQPFDKFADRPMSLSLQDESGIVVTPPADIWLEATTQQQNNVTEFIVYNAILASEVTQLGDEQLVGEGSNLKLILRDRANLSNLIATQIVLDYGVTRSGDPRFRPASDFTSKYQGTIPPEAIVREGDRLTILLGQLPIAPEYLKKQTGVRISLTANRSFAGHSAEQKISLEGVVGASSR